MKLFPQTGLRFMPQSRKGARELADDHALRLGLLFRALAPIRSRDNIGALAEGIEVLEREQASYWVGMAMHRKNPRPVLTALCFLLTDRRRG